MLTPDPESVPNIVTWFDEHARLTPHRQAVCFPQGLDAVGRQVYTQLTFEQLCSDSQGLACRLQKFGIAPGERVLVFIKPALEFSIVIFALLRLGAVPVFIDPGMGIRALLKCVGQTQAKAAIGEPIIGWLRWLAPKAFYGMSVIISTKPCLPIQKNLTYLLRAVSLVPEAYTPTPVGPEGIAAIVFTSGGTGTPKGVVYTHGNFAAQIQALQRFFQFTPGTDKDLAAFPLFSLLTLCMGVTSVIAPMNPSRPAQASPEALVQTIQTHGITTAAGSPAIWEKVAFYCQAHARPLPSIRWLMLFGAPVSHKLHKAFQGLLPSGDTCTPYGATECLPVTCITGQEILQDTAKDTLLGQGVCVGKPLPGVSLRILDLTCATPVDVPPGHRGEIAVKALQASGAYLHHLAAASKIPTPEGKAFWHRMGDIGYLDTQGRLWFLGRRAHSFLIDKRWFYPIACEAIFNQHVDVLKSALILKQPSGEPALVIQRRDLKTTLSATKRQHFKDELLQWAQSSPVTRGLCLFYLKESLPVDTRHNIKIDRLALGKEFGAPSKETL